MLNLDAQRFNMIEAQIRTNDVRDSRICDAMMEIPRELFVPAAKAPVAYMEACIEVKPGRVLMDPRCFAKLVQAASVQADDKVLVAGCGTGYSALVLARLGGSVIGLEEDAELAAAARSHVAALGADTVRVVEGSLRDGCPAEAPFDVIVVDGGIAIRPDALLAQLGEGGRLVCVRTDGPVGHAHVFLKHDGAISDRVLFDAQVPVLPGFERQMGFVF